MAERLGAWKNAPLAYVLAEVRTEQLSDLKNYQPELAAVFRSELPIQRALVTARIVVSTVGAQSTEVDQDSAWEFASPENRVGLILRPHGFVLHATRYQDHAEFLGRFQEALQAISVRIPSIYLNRLGLRYVDFVIPKKGEVPEDYVDRRLSPQLDVVKASGPVAAMSAVVYPMPHGRLTLRYIRSAGQPRLPPDLSTVALEKSPLMNAGNVAATQPAAVIDIDRIREFDTRELLDPARVRREFQGMHDEISELFKKRIITDHARKVWGAE